MNSPASKESYRNAVSLLFFAFGFGFATWASRIPDIQHSLKLKDSELGFLLFAIPFGDLITIPVSAWVSARFGTKNITFYAGFAYAAILFLLSTANSVSHLTFYMCLMGIASNFLSICLNTQSIIVQRLYIKSIIGSFHGIWSFAGFGGALLGSLMIWLNISTIWHFAIASSVIVLLMSITTWYLQEDQSQSEHKKKIFAIPDSSLLTLGFLALSCMVIEGTMFDWSGIYFRKVVMPGQELEGMGYAVFMGSMASGRFISDKFLDKFGRKTTLITSSSLITIGLLLAVLQPFLIPATIGFIMVGFGVAPVVPLVYGLAGKSQTYQASTALTIVGSIGFIGFLCGPPLIGTLTEIINLRGAFLVIACFGACIGLISVFRKVY